ncbi:MAG: electron transfer flavoprotein subunit beta/FixA family protein [Thermodesulfobacteriota bacterium]
MLLIVCIKPVPDPKEWGRLRMHPETKTLIREGIPTVMNPLDRHALEAALTLKEDAGGEIRVVTMAPPFGRTVFKEALAMGADSGVLISDPIYAGSDTLATSRILCAAIRRMGPFDLVLCGNSSLDGSTAQVPSQLAEMLGIPNVMHVCRLVLGGPGGIRLSQRVEMGVVEMEAEPPLLLSFTKEVNKPRYTTFLGILDAESKGIEMWGNEELRLDPGSVGLRGSPTKMADLLLRSKTRQGQRVQGDPEEAARRVADRLSQLGII